MAPPSDNPPQHFASRKSRCRIVKPGDQSIGRFDQDRKYPDPGVV